MSLELDNPYGPFQTELLCDSDVIIPVSQQHHLELIILFSTSLLLCCVPEKGNVCVFLFGWQADASENCASFVFRQHRQCKD